MKEGESLEITGEQLISAPRQRVWDSLNDPQVLRQCVPGCEEMVRLSDNKLEAKVLTKIGPLRARFSGRLEMADVNAPESCTLLFEGGAGSVGMAQGHVRVTLRDAAEGTHLHYAAEAAIGGKLGQIGGRLIDASVKKMADDFFRSLNLQLNPVLSTESATAVTAVLEGAAVGTSIAARRPERSAEPGTFSAGWSGEFQRLLWFMLGAAAGSALGHFIRF